MGKWGNGKQKGYATDSLQANSMYKLFIFGSFVSHFLKFVESMNRPYLIQRVILKLLLHALACIVMDIHTFVSHTAPTACTTQTSINTTKCLLQSFISGYTHCLCREYNHCVFACTEWSECTTALYLSKTILFIV